MAHRRDLPIRLCVVCVCVCVCVFEIRVTRTKCDKFDYFHFQLIGSTFPIFTHTHIHTTWKRIRLVNVAIFLFDLNQSITWSIDIIFFCELKLKNNYCFSIILVTSIQYYVQFSLLFVMLSSSSLSYYVALPICLHKNETNERTQFWWLRKVNKIQFGLLPRTTTIHKTKLRWGEMQ